MEHSSYVETQEAKQWLKAICNVFSVSFDIETFNRLPWFQINKIERLICSLNGRRYKQEIEKLFTEVSNRIEAIILYPIWKYHGHDFINLWETLSQYFREDCDVVLTLI